jgi:glycosyltransferase involved in cell wall biosynthesis
MAKLGWRVTVVARHVDQELSAAWPIPPLPNLAVRKLRQQNGLATEARFTISALIGMFLLSGRISPMLSGRWLLRAQPIADVIKELRPDVIHAHFGPNGIEASLATRASSLPLLINFHGYDVTSFPAAHSWKLYREMVDRSRTTAIAHSDFVRGRLHKNTNLSVRSVPLGVDLQRFCPVAKQTDWPRALKILSVGRLARIKGHDLAVEAVVEIMRSGRGYQLEMQIVGEGSERAALMAQIEKFKAGGFIRLVGHVPYSKVSDLMRAADLVICASRREDDGSEEAYCRVAIEAIACGIPVVGTPTGGLPEAIGEAGIIAAGLEPKDLAEAICKVLRSGTPADWSKQAIHRAKNLDMAAMLSAYDQLTLETLGNCARTTNRK